MTQEGARMIETDARQEFELAIGEGRALADLSADCLRMIRNALPYAGEPHAAYLAATWAARPLPRDSFEPCSEPWQPIATYPDGADYALLSSPAHGRVIGAHVVGDVWHLVGVGTVSSVSERPTYWMPVPAPPGETR